jgi:hypothetical protein
MPEDCETIEEEDFDETNSVLAVSKNGADTEEE